MSKVLPFRQPEPEPEPTPAPVAPVYYSVTETAKLLRLALRERFPATKFSVRCSQYAGGASIDVQWTDGPTAKFVDEIAGEFSGATFDGVIDLKSHHVSEYQGKRVRWGADYVFTRRRASCPFYRRVVALVAAQLGIDVPAITEGEFDCYIAHGQDRGDYHVPGGHSASGFSIGQVVRMVLEDHSLLYDLYPQRYP